MKVTTDGCLFGAIVAKELSDKGNCRVLDIGTGTGLLSLMVAQENKSAMMDAIEIDAAASGQAMENGLASPWGARIQVVNADILQYQPAFAYDFVISNPPFYESQWSSPVAGRQLAHHSSGLTLQQLFERVKKLLEREGKLLVLLPYYRTEEATAIAHDNGLFVEKKWQIKQTPKHSYLRTIICFSRNVAALPEPAEITIRSSGNDYSRAFTDLLQPFYLYL